MPDSVAGDSAVQRHDATAGEPSPARRVVAAVDVMPLLEEVLANQERLLERVEVLTATVREQGEEITLLKADRQASGR